MKVSLNVRLQVCQCNREKDLFHPYVFNFPSTGWHKAKKPTLHKNLKKIPVCV